MKALVFPGQGAQFRGMGRDLFDAYPEAAEQASDILGYDLPRLCLHDPHRVLNDTEYTQPALFVVGALAHRRWREENGDAAGYLAGHSLGEYCALHAAGAFDFATGVRLVQRRGALMARARGGGMVAVVGVDGDRLAALLAEGAFTTLTVANHNTPTQHVVSGDAETIGALETHLEDRKVRCVRLKVSGAFHSPLMRPAQEEFAAFLRDFRLDDPRLPVIANATARPYPAGRTADLLTRQITSPVRWTESVHHLLDLGVNDFVELGGTVVGRLVDQIRTAPRPAPAAPPPAPRADEAPPRPAGPPPAPRSADAAPAATELGSAVFRRRLGLRYAYAAGGMYRGIASPRMVIALARRGMLGILGTGGTPHQEIEEGLRTIRAALGPDRPFGVNFLAHHDDPAAERAMADLLLRQDVRIVEASAFIRMTPALVLYRARGLRRGPDGTPVCDHRVVAKVSRPEVARAFMAPAPDAVLDRLVRDGDLDAHRAELARQVPMSHDITVEADSGGHTDGGISTVMMPAMHRLRQEAQHRHGYAEPICLGLAGGLGTPEAVAAAFMLGADYVLTGSVNQCTVEAGTSDAVKDMLQDIDIHDTEYAPAGDMFEMGAKVQVLRKGVFFPTRANKLFSLYSHYDGLDELPARTRDLLERTYFRRTLDEVWEDTRAHLRSRGRHDDLARAEANPKLRMALVFRWYFAHTAQLALNGRDDRTNYQVHTGPALGSFNQWVKGTDLERWRERHVDDIGVRLLEGAAEHIGAMYRGWHGPAPAAPRPVPRTEPAPTGAA
ncbi:ACP S-malonyltransferase [Streptomyces sp. NPDC051041]|uniref:ACP S-malonyltransferase n=1 Tax=Streptomyces sp. NPDC051041 TaxID=3365640 RepID=UPI00379DB32C